MFTVAFWLMSVLAYSHHGREGTESPITIYDRKSHFSEPPSFTSAINHHLPRAPFHRDSIGFIYAFIPRKLVAGSRTFVIEGKQKKRGRFRRSFMKA